MRFPRLPILAVLASTLVLVAAAPVAAAGASVAVPTGAADAPSAAAAAGPAATPSVSFPEQAAAARRFWTPQRMKAAVPIEGPEVAAEASALDPALTSTSETIDDPTLPEYRVNGAIFISEGAGIGFGRCSGTSVVSPSGSVVITAGHCVYDGGIWSDRKWVFVPGYHHGERPFGTFTAHWLGTTPAWHAHENENFDVGTAVVGRNEKGQTLAAAVGADKVATGLSPHQSFDVYGYPVEKPFNGGTLQVCREAGFEGHDFGSLFEPGPLDLSISCDDSAGGSGGGWVIDGDTVNSVTTYGYPSDPFTNFGPYFGQDVANLYARAKQIR
jgi:V8-like Glu-specific endopeptidase